MNHYWASDLLSDMSVIYYQTKVKLATVTTTICPEAVSAQQASHIYKYLYMFLMSGICHMFFSFSDTFPYISDESPFVLFYILKVVTSLRNIEYIDEM